MNRGKNKHFKFLVSSKNKNNFKIFILVLLGLYFISWIISGLYFLQPNTVAVITKRDGSITLEKRVGMHYNLPAPFNYIDTIDNSEDIVEFSSSSLSFINLDHQAFNINFELKYGVDDIIGNYKLLNNSDVDMLLNLIKNILIADVRTFFANHNSHYLLQTNYNTIASDLLLSINQSLASLHYKVNSIKINSITLIQQQDSKIATTVAAVVQSSRDVNNRGVLREVHRTRFN